jgi:hypothetical protein
MIQAKIVKIICALFLLISCQSLTFALPARHTFHTSLTRMDYNAQEKMLEISIQLFTHDLLPTLQKRTGKQVDLEKTPGVDELILAYLNQNLILRDKNGEAQKLTWIGKEIEVDTTYVYVQIPLTADFEESSSI